MKKYSELSKLAQQICDDKQGRVYIHTSDKALAKIYKHYT